ncbi:phage tail fiber protein [Acinetobacter baumannii]|uniref:phage tail fiber protein n=1 Tax=Acinetobacter baumannii TaxID=470 RepID=UPI000D653EA9|nr:pyocin knob domain-containing protein [Acinetobacter baumannii]
MANLVFKYSWDHRPYPYNSAQGKRQFMLPFASGIPNLTPDWTQVTGLGSAATGTLTAGSFDKTLGRVVKVGDFGVGIASTLSTSSDMDTVINTGNFSASNASNPNAPPSGTAGYVQINEYNPVSFFARQEWKNVINQRHYFRSRTADNVWTQWGEYRTTANTTVDANGFVKSASPIVKLYAESIELNDEANKQPIHFEKLDVGDYLLKGSLGFAQEGWYIEVPKDANGNTVVAVEYSTLENGDISIKTYKRKFDVEKAAIVADHDNPFDIPEGRWIDIRLHEEPPEPLSETPVEFQPTNLSQAVAAAMNGVEPPEISDTDATP